MVGEWRESRSIHTSTRGGCNDVVLNVSHGECSDAKFLKVVKPSIGSCMA